MKLFHPMDKQKVRNLLKMSSETQIVLTIGSQDEVKGTRYLIEAFGMLRRRRKGDLLFGSHRRRSIEGTSVSCVHDQRSGISESVIFLGRRPHGEIPLWLNAADVFCLPSL